MKEYALEMKNINVRYPSSSEFALKNINIQIEKGEFVAIVGESGSGKTSLVRTINGLSYSYYEAEVNGNIIFNGKDITRKDIGDIAQNIGTVFQNPRTQFFNLDTSAELIFGCENIGLTVEEIGKRIDEKINEFALGKLINRDIFKLSGGEKQKIAIAEVLAMGPEILLLDEVSSNLDLIEIGNLKKILLRLKENGNTVLINEHRLYWLNDLIDRYIYIKNGEINNTFTNAEFLNLSQEELHSMGLRNTQMKFDSSVNIERIFTLESKKFLSIRDKNFKMNVKDFNTDVGVLGIIGKNGEGKSTFIEGLLGLIKNEGYVFLDSKVISTHSCSYVMQDVTRQLFKETVFKEAVFCNSVSERETLDVLRFLNLEDKKDRHPQSLSGGEKQRVAIANSILSGRKICIMDEPTSGLDYKNMMGLAELICKLKQKGILVMVITHDFELLDLCCDTILEIEQGQGIVYPYTKEQIEEKFYKWLKKGEEDY